MRHCSSAKAGIVLNLFLNFEQKRASCSYKIVLIKFITVISSHETFVSKAFDSSSIPNLVKPKIKITAKELSYLTYTSNEKLEVCCGR